MKRVVGSPRDLAYAPISALLTKWSILLSLPPVAASQRGLVRPRGDIHLVVSMRDEET
jgi:hypothetical protein